MCMNIYLKYISLFVCLMFVCQIITHEPLDRCYPKFEREGCKLSELTCTGKT